MVLVMHHERITIGMIVAAVNLLKALSPSQNAVLEIKFVPCNDDLCKSRHDCRYFFLDMVIAYYVLPVQPTPMYDLTISKAWRWQAKEPNACHS